MYMIVHFEWISHYFGIGKNRIWLKILNGFIYINIKLIKEFNYLL